MSAEKPTIILIPGAWHKADTFEPVASILRTQGYPVQAMTLLSAGGPPSTTVADDAEYIRKRYLLELVAHGKEIVLVMHSYSGIPGTESVSGLARKDLAARGKPGGVIALVYVTAFLIPAGQSVESLSPHGVLDPAMKIDVRDIWIYTRFILVEMLGIRFDSLTNVSITGRYHIRQKPEGVLLQ